MANLSYDLNNGGFLFNSILARKYERIRAGKTTKNVLGILQEKMILSTKNYQYSVELLGLY